MFNFIARVLSCLNCNKLRQRILDQEAVIAICADSLKKRDNRISELLDTIAEATDEIEQLNEASDHSDRTISRLQHDYTMHTSHLLDANTECTRLKARIVELEDPFGLESDKITEIDILEEESKLWIPEN